MNAGISEQGRLTGNDAKLGKRLPPYSPQDTSFLEKKQK